MCRPLLKAKAKVIPLPLYLEAVTRAWAHLRAHPSWAISSFSACGIFDYDKPGMRARREAMDSTLHKRGYSQREDGSWAHNTVIAEERRQAADVNLACDESTGRCQWDDCLAKPRNLRKPIFTCRDCDQCYHQLCAASAATDQCGCVARESLIASGAMDASSLPATDHAIQCEDRLVQADNLDLTLLLRREREAHARTKAHLAVARRDLKDLREVAAFQAENEGVPMISAKLGQPMNDAAAIAKAKARDDAVAAKERLAEQSKLATSNKRAAKELQERRDERAKLAKRATETWDDDHQKWKVWQLQAMLKKYEQATQHPNGKNFLLKELKEEWKNFVDLRENMDPEWEYELCSVVVPPPVDEGPVPTSSGPAGP